MVGMPLCVGEELVCNSFRNAYTGLDEVVLRCESKVEPKLPYLKGRESRFKLASKLFCYGA
jgi:hypothetical protein